MLCKVQYTPGPSVHSANKKVVKQSGTKNTIECIDIPTHAYSFIRTFSKRNT